MPGQDALYELHLWLPTLQDGPRQMDSEKQILQWTVKMPVEIRLHLFARSFSFGPDDPQS
jgi:hypothetical protein